MLTKHTTLNTDEAGGQSAQGISVSGRGHKDLYRPVIYLDPRRCNHSRTKLTWRAADEGKIGSNNSLQLFSDPTFPPSRSNNRDRTGKWPSLLFSSSNHLQAPGYLTTSLADLESIVLSYCKVKSFPSANTELVISVAVSYTMKGESCRNQAAIKDLHHAQETYETQTL